MDWNTWRSVISASRLLVTTSSEWFFSVFLMKRRRCFWFMQDAAWMCVSTWNSNQILTPPYTMIAQQQRFQLVGKSIKKFLQVTSKPSAHFWTNSHFLWQVLRETGAFCINHASGTEGAAENRPKRCSEKIWEIIMESLSVLELVLSTFLLLSIRL